MLRYIIMFLNITAIASPSFLNLESDTKTFESFKERAAQLSKSTNKSKTEQEIKIFIENLEKQKELLFQELTRNSPKSDNEQPSQQYIKIQEQYERLLEIYVAFEALKAQLQISAKDRSCSQFIHDYSLSAGEDKNKYSLYQTTVLRLHNLICK